MLTGDSWLDPSTVKLFMDVKNPDSANITPIVSGAWGMFRRLRILCAGQIIEDIDGCSRLSGQFHMMKPADKRANDDIEGFGAKDPVPAGKSRTVCFTPLSGLLSQENIFRSGILPSRLS